MTPSPLLDAALKRLAGALDRLEAASGRLDEAGAERRDLDEALGLMADDRARLAADLDRALGRREALERATDEVASRLDRAGTLLRELVGARAAADRRDEGGA